MSRAGDSLGADAQEVESRVSVQVGVNVRDWRHQRFSQEIFWGKLTKLNITRDVRHRRDSPRGKLHCNAYVSLQSGRAGRKALYGEPAPGTDGWRD